MAFRATHKYARISARKVRPLADLVRGKFADEALDLLKYQPQRGARMLEKVLRSAVGNAQDPDQNRGTVAESRAIGGDRRTRRWWSDVQADSSAGAWHGLRDFAAYGAHHRRAGIDRGSVGIHLPRVVANYNRSSEC